MIDEKVARDIRIIKYSVLSIVSFMFIGFIAFALPVTPSLTLRLDVLGVLSLAFVSGAITFSTMLNKMLKFIFRFLKIWKNGWRKK